MVFLCAGVSAGLVAEEFAFDDAFWQRAAVDGDERPVPAAAEAMQGCGDDFLAGAGFAFDEHVDVGVRDMAQGLLDALHGGRGADERHLRRPRR